MPIEMKSLQLMGQQDQQEKTISFKIADHEKTISMLS
jgi:hypothetical protein